MVIVRTIAEMAVCIGLIAIPIVLELQGKMHSIPAAWAFTLIVAAIVASALLPWYGFITWVAKTDPLGLTLWCLFKKQFCSWGEIKSISRQSNWNNLRYVLETKTGEDVSFPVQLKHSDELVKEIRSHLPAGAGSPPGDGVRKFQHDTIAARWQIAQALFGFIFIAIVWTFFNTLRTRTDSTLDSMIILLFCLVITGLLLWRTYVVALMPLSIRLADNEMVMRTYFFERKITFEKLLSIKPASPFLPRRADAQDSIWFVSNWRQHERSRRVARFADGKN